MEKSQVELEVDRLLDEVLGVLESSWLWKQASGTLRKSVRVALCLALCRLMSKARQRRAEAALEDPYDGSPADTR